MNTAQLPFLVEGILILACMIPGILLGRAGKPYGKVKQVVHLFLFVWFAAGLAFILYGLFAIGVMNATWIPVAMMGLMILTLLVTGIAMMASNKAGKALPMVHTLLATLMVLTDISAFIIAGLRP